MNCLGTAAHVFLFESADPFANFCFDLSLSLHRGLDSARNRKTICGVRLGGVRATKTWTIDCFCAAEPSYHARHRAKRGCVLRLVPYH